MNIGNVSILDLRVGGMPVQSAYDGEHLVWTRQSPAGDYWGLCFTAEEANSTVAMTAETGAPAVTLEYSTNANDWSPFTVGSTTVTLARAGDKVWLRAGSGGNQGMTQNEKVNTFTLTGKVAASGDIMSILDGETQLTAIPTGNCFYKLFSDCTSLVSPPELPATSLQAGCYHTMFKGCTNLTAVPELPATSTQAACYQHMFDGCTSLSNADIVLSAVTLTDSCYAQMFTGCTSLASPPVISAQTVVTRSCWSMFEGCSSLSAAPVLYGTSLAQYCYQYMFRNCTHLSSVEVKFTSWPYSTSTSNWLTNVASNGTFTCPTALGTNETITRGNNNCPTNWTVVNLDA